MLPGTVQNQYGVSAGGHLRADFLEMLVHRRGIDRRHDDGRADAALRADGAEQMCGVLAIDPSP